MTDPRYDFRDALPAGLLLTRERELALAAAYQSNGFQPLSPSQAVAAVGPALTPPTSIKRLERCSG